jgi:hypothetical protein
MLMEESDFMTSEVIDRVARTFDSRLAGASGIIEGDRAMIDVNTIANRYIDLWNERTPSRRRELLAANWTHDARYVDPLMSGDGHDGVDALIAGVQQRFPDFRFRLLGEPNGYGQHVRFCWGLGANGAESAIKGTDFAVVEDGRIRSVTGFLDQVPASA